MRTTYSSFLPNKEWKVKRSRDELKSTIAEKKKVLREVYLIDNELVFPGNRESKERQVLLSRLTSLNEAIHDLRKEVK